MVSLPFDPLYLKLLMASLVVLVLKQDVWGSEDTDTFLKSSLVSFYLCARRRLGGEEENVLALSAA